MAEGGDQETNLEKVGNCPVCSECIFESGTQYLCVHKFCTQCGGLLPEIHDKGQLSIECPLCRGFVQNEEIRMNRTLNVLINLFKEDEEPGSKTISCLQCDSTDVTSKCLACNIDLCQKCRDRHLKIPGFMEHRIVLLSEITPQPMKDAIVYCNKHPDKQIDKKCKPCNKVICSQCKVEDHDTHKSESLKIAFIRFRQLVRNSLEKIQHNLFEKQNQITTIVTAKEALEKNQMEIQSKLEEHRDKLKEKIEQQYEVLIDELSTNIGSQIKSLDLQKETLEHSKRCHESLKSWTESITENNDRCRLVTEVQSEMLDRMKHLEEEPTKYGTVCKFYKYQPSDNMLGKIIAETSECKVTVGKVIQQIPLVVPEPVQHAKITIDQKRAHNIIEEEINIQFSPDEINCIDNLYERNNQSSKVDKRQYNIPKFNNVTSFRVLKDFKGIFYLKKVNTVYIGGVNKYRRFCLFQNLLWVPCDNNTLEGLSLDLKIVQTINLHTIKTPRSLYPLDNDNLLVASGSGLHIIDSSGNVKLELYGERCHDVGVNNNVVAAVCSNRLEENVTGKILIWDTSDISHIKNSFTMEFKNAYGSAYFSLLVAVDSIFVAHIYTNQIHQYDLQGKLIAQFDNCPINGPRLCAIDSRGNLMVADRTRKNCLKIMSRAGPSWSSVGLMSRGAHMSRAGHMSRPGHMSRGANMSRGAHMSRGTHISRPGHMSRAGHMSRPGHMSRGAHMSRGTHTLRPGHMSRGAHMSRGGYTSRGTHMSRTGPSSVEVQDGHLNDVIVSDSMMYFLYDDESSITSYRI